MNYSFKLALLMLTIICVVFAYGVYQMLGLTAAILWVVLFGIVSFRLLFPAN